MSRPSRHIHRRPLSHRGSARAVRKAATDPARCRSCRRSHPRSGLIQVGIGHKERVHVPQREREGADDLADQVNGEAPFVAWRRGRVQIPAEGIGAVHLDHIPRIHDIAEALGHLLAFAIQDQAEAEDVLIRNGIHQQGADGVQRVEPAARLIHGLADVVRRELGLELLLVLERIVPLREGHGAGIEPDVDQVLDAPHRAAALGTGVGHLVDVGSMEIQVRKIVANFCRQLAHRRRCTRGTCPGHTPRRAAACPSSAPG